MFDTPQEAALKAENARLRAENEWLRRAVEGPDRTVKPWGVETEMIVRDIPPELRMAHVGGVTGTLQRDGRWNVVARQERLDAAKSLSVAYYTDGYHRKHIDDMTFVNHILPKMHETFIRTLSEIYARQHSR